MARKSSFSLSRIRLYFLVVSLTACISFITILNHISFADFIFDNKPIIESSNDTAGEELHILSYFTFPKPGAMQMTYFCNCVRFNAQLNINIKYLGDDNLGDEAYAGANTKATKRLKHIGKLQATSEYIHYLTQQHTIEQQKKSIIILFVDGYDVIFQRNYSYILNQFIKVSQQYEYQNKVIWMADQHCWPLGDWCDKFINIAPNGINTTHLNSGGWIGYLYDVNLMYQLFKHTLNKFNNNLMEIKYKFTDDQGFCSHHYFVNNSNMKLDYYTQIFQKYDKKAVKDIVFLKENGFYNNETNNYPAILHFAGATGKYYILLESKQLAIVYIEKGIMSLKRNPPLHIQFVTNNGTITRLKYSHICGNSLATSFWRYKNLKSLIAKKIIDD